MPCVMSMSGPTPVASTSTSETVQTTEVVTPSEENAVRLKLRKPKSKKKVVWSSNTVDNENMNKKKSKCCCIYEKPREFGESSSDTDDECDHCRGHAEQKKTKTTTLVQTETENEISTPQAPIPPES